MSILQSIREKTEANKALKRIQARCNFIKQVFDKMRLAITDGKNKVEVIFNFPFESCEDKLNAGNLYDFVNRLAKSFTSRGFVVFTSKFYEDTSWDPTYKISVSW
jgi:hypothetical protein